MLITDRLYSLYRRLHHTWYGRRIAQLGKLLVSLDPFHRKLKIKGKGSLLISKRIIGKNNSLETASGVCLDRVLIKIQGSNNRICIGKNTTIGKNCSILFFGDNMELVIGENCSFSHDDEILVQENYSKIIIGNDCMFSHHINIRTSDAHPIFDIISGSRINPAKDIIIGDHVWVGANVIIQKGSVIGNDTVVATCSVVNHRSSSIRDNCNLILAGTPANPVKSNINWNSRLNS